MTPTPLPALGDVENALDLKRFSGDWLIFRKRKGYIKPGVGGRKMPHFRHKTLASAETEAARLATAFPDSTFVLMREVGSAKLVSSTIKETS